jgi:hypothetical protein
MGARVDVWRFHQKSKHDAPVEPVADGYSRSEQLLIRNAENLVRIVNESIRLAANGKTLKTRRSRLALAKEKLVDLKKIANESSFIHLTSLAEFEKSLRAVDIELFTYEHSGLDPGSRWIFMAALYLRTPLNVLQHHGVIERCAKDRLPVVAGACPMSGWRKLPETTMRSLGVDMDDPPERPNCDMGYPPANGEPYMTFLLEFRTIIENTADRDAKHEKINLLCERSIGGDAIRHFHGGVTEMLRMAEQPRPTE